MAEVTKEEYLKRYLSGDAKKKKRKPKIKKEPRDKPAPRMRIFDESDGLDCRPSGDAPIVDLDASDDEGLTPQLELLGQTTADELALLGKFKKDAFSSVPAQPTGRRRHDSSGSSDAEPTRRPASGAAVQVDSDQSPPRKGAPDSDSDLDLPRRGAAPDDDSDIEVERGPKEGTGLRATKTLSGATAGLQSAAALRKEADALRRRDAKSFKKTDKAALGKDAETVFRNRAAGTRRDLGAEKEDAAAKAAAAEELAAKYKKWNKGVAQLKDREERLQEAAKVAEQPLARYSGNEELESHLKSVELTEDPMLEYMTKKKGRSAKVAHLPKYTGRPAPPNRFGIGPGYRWDGVDRGNGFELKIYQRNNDRKANQEEFYKWQSGNYE